MPRVAAAIDARSVLSAIVTDATDGTDRRIFDAAARALLLGGLEGVEVDAVASATGVARSTIYRRHGSRNGLIAATVGDLTRQVLTELARAVDADAPMSEQIVQAFTAGVRMIHLTGLGRTVRDDDRLLRLVTVESAPLVATARDHLTELASTRFPGLRPAEVAPAAELLIRLALSVLVAPPPELAGPDDRATRPQRDEPDLESAVRRLLGPVIADR